MSSTQKQHIAIAIAFIFHFCGAIGILCTPYKNWFINNTPINLLLMLCLIVFTQQNNHSFKVEKQFIFFAVIAMVVGFAVEVLGVNTHLLFGNYSYKNVLGYQLFNVPLLIGVQWFVIIYCCGNMLQFVNIWAKKKLQEHGEKLDENKKTQIISLIIDAALLATFFDFIIEPAAQKLGYWQWQDGIIPFYNYTCWFFVSALLLLAFNMFQFNKLNKFAIHLFVIQLLFFIAIRLHL